MNTLEAMNKVILFQVIQQNFYTGVNAALEALHCTKTREEFDKKIKELYKEHVLLIEKNINEKIGSKENGTREARHKESIFSR